MPQTEPTTENIIRQIAPQNFAGARALAHCAIQLPSMAARANLPPAPGDAHSNLTWDDQLNGFWSNAMTSEGTEYRVGIALFPLRMCVVTEDKIVSELPLADLTRKHAHAWLDAQLELLGLNPASSAHVPYNLPEDVAAIETFSTLSETQPLQALAAWFKLTNDTLTTFAKENQNIEPGPSSVRCWPHHFDLATYVSLAAGDAETAKGIGIGLSPGDEGYAEPYLYINPWPHLNASKLPTAPQYAHWHTTGYVGLVATGTELLKTSNLTDELPALINAAFSVGRKEIGA